MHHTAFVFSPHNAIRQRFRSLTFCCYDFLCEGPKCEGCGTNLPEEDEKKKKKKKKDRKSKEVEPVYSMIPVKVKEDAYANLFPQCHTDPNTFCAGCDFGFYHKANDKAAQLLKNKNKQKKKKKKKPDKRRWCHGCKKIHNAVCRGCSHPFISDKATKKGEPGCRAQNCLSCRQDKKARKCSLCEAAFHNEVAVTEGQPDLCYICQDIAARELWKCRGCKSFNSGLTNDCRMCKKGITRLKSDWMVQYAWVALPDHDPSPRCECLKKKKSGSGSKTSSGKKSSGKKS
jgi:hypothetical protein